MMVVSLFHYLVLCRSFLMFSHTACRCFYLVLRVTYIEGQGSELRDRSYRTHDRNLWPQEEIALHQGDQQEWGASTSKVLYLSKYTLPVCHSIQKARHDVSREFLESWRKRNGLLLVDRHKLLEIRCCLNKIVWIKKIRKISFSLLFRSSCKCFQTILSL